MTRTGGVPFEPDRQLGALRKQADDAAGMPDDGQFMPRALKDVYDPALRETLTANRDAGADAASDGEGRELEGSPGAYARWTRRRSG